jgi:hypothetical protein
MQSLDKTDRVIINLKVIAMLKDGQRLCIRNNQFSVWEPGWTQALVRWGFGENRWVNVEEMQTVIHDALRLLGTYMNLVQHAYGATPLAPDKYAIAVPTPSASLGFVSTLARDLEYAIEGLQSLRRTYATDPLMVATLDVLVERTQTEIEKAKQLLVTANSVAPTPTPTPTRYGTNSAPDYRASGQRSSDDALNATINALDMETAAPEASSASASAQAAQPQLVVHGGGGGGGGGSSNTGGSSGNAYAKKGKFAPLPSSSVIGI